MATNSTSIEASQPASVYVREATRASHERVGSAQGARWLAGGQLAKEEYAHYLVLLWHVYDELERSLAAHANDPVIRPVYVPAIFSRADHVAADIGFLLNTATAEGAWRAHPMVAGILAAPPQVLIEYTARIKYLCAEHPRLLVAHAYARYLGDLSGGQIIRKNVAKAYGLDREDGDGLQLYAFRALNRDAPASANEVKVLKEFWRERLDGAVGGDVELKVALAEESKLAFVLNEGLLSTLKGPAYECVYVPGRGAYNIVRGGASSNKSVKTLVVLASIIGAAGLAHYLYGGGRGQ
ncbi:heme oxygenase-like protein [Coniophora puteana RWD-64-598 SS2]|uniref:Heme oxygenase-like protein n=1 Tax=Coniophora puteana (strain RWD-64-598) TaxID=741705 RepID=R7SFS0_CONPW|nr:heme oxygenase-like protein [Coniophora puteana RWD-64-598 SS2]EIW74695.1 heme oxygenase-like protein [Coniophora puteana RWD-64-598 SS2]